VAPRPPGAARARRGAPARPPGAEQARGPHGHPARRGGAADDRGRVRAARGGRRAGRSAAEVVQPLEWTPGADALLRTPFDAIQRRYGGRFAEWEGWDWISDFGDPLAEHHAVREAVGVWDESPLRKWAFRGPDALAAADFLFTNDMSTLQVGQVRYGAFCDERGRMLGDGTVLNGGDGPLGILAVTALESDGDHFRQVCAGRFDVEIVERTAELPHVQVQGPRSRELLVALTDAPVADLRYFRFLPDPVTVGGVPGATSRARATRASSATRSSVRRGCRGALPGPARPGRQPRHPPVRLAAVESIRIESA
jgi:aminomethyltransferase